MDTRRFATSLLICVSAFSLLGMGRIKTDRSREAKYSPMIGRIYKTKTDLIIYKNDDSKEMMVGHYGDGVPEREGMKKKFPYRYYDSMILGILPAESIFRVKRVTEEGSPTASFIYYYVDIISSADKAFVNKEVDPTFLTDRKDPPQFNLEFVEEISR